MNTTTPRPVRNDHTIIRVLAALLERLEHSGRTVDAQQYRTVVLRLTDALKTAEPGDGLRAVLDGCPAAGALYENIHYAHAGLCRSGLDTALTAERQARQWIDRAKSMSAGPVSPSAGPVARAVDLQQRIDPSA